MAKKIHLCLARMSEAGLEQKYIQEAIETKWVAPLGPNVDAFEADLRNYIGQGKEVVVLSSGTAAVHLSLIACGVGPGDEVGGGHQRPYSQNREEAKGDYACSSLWYALRDRAYHGDW